MNKRQRKKWLKKHGKYVSRSELWSMPYTLAEYILPRLKLYRKDAWGYPGVDEVSTFEDWMNIIDKMIISFEYIIEEDNWWIDNPKYDYTNGLKFERFLNDDGMWQTNLTEEDWIKPIKEAHFIELKRRQDVIEEGLQLFSKWFQRLGN